MEIRLEGDAAYVYRYMVIALHVVIVHGNLIIFNFRLSVTSRLVER